VAVIFTTYLGKMTHIATSNKISIYCSIVMLLIVSCKYMLCDHILLSLNWWRCCYCCWDDYAVWGRLNETWFKQETE